MKKQLLMIAALATMMATAVNAQTRVGEIQEMFYNYLPAELTSGGVALLADYDDDACIFIDNNLNVTELQLPERCAFLRYLNLY